MYSPVGNDQLARRLRRAGRSWAALAKVEDVSVRSVSSAGQGRRGCRFCVEMGVPGLQPRPVVELAKLLREVGFDGAGYAILTGLRLDETLRASAEAGLEIYLAAEAGVRISAYNHVKCWNESVPLNVELVKQVNHPQVGFNFNVCHWLKIAGNKDYRPLLQANADKLFCVTICGATNRGEHLDQRPHPAARPRRI